MEWMTGGGGTQEEGGGGNTISPQDAIGELILTQGRRRETL